jgi:hypothetical protein
MNSHGVTMLRQTKESHQRNSEELLTPEELASLEQVNRGIYGNRIPPHHAKRLMALRLVYSLLGDLRITGVGRSFIRRKALAVCT